MAKRGRPLKEIDLKSFESLCGLQCTLIEFCCFFGCDDKTLESWCRRTYKKNFSEVFALKRAAGLISLRRSQFRLAENNATMGIWLVKQYLGQRDIQEIEVSKKTSETISEIEAYLDKNDAGSG